MSALVYECMVMFRSFAMQGSVATTTGIVVIIGLTANSWGEGPEYDDAWLTSQARDFIQERFRRINEVPDIDVFGGPVKLSDYDAKIVDEGNRNDRIKMEFTVKEAIGLRMTHLGRFEVTITPGPPDLPNRQPMNQEIYFSRFSVDSNIPPQDVDLFKRIAPSFGCTSPETMASIDKDGHVHLKQVSYCPLMEIVRHDDGLYFVRFSDTRAHQYDGCEVAFSVRDGKWHPELMVIGSDNKFLRLEIIQNFPTVAKPVRLPQLPPFLVDGGIESKDIESIIGAAMCIPQVNGKIGKLSKLRGKNDARLYAGDPCGVEPSTQVILKSVDRILVPVVTIHISGISGYWASAFPSLGPHATRNEVDEWKTRAVVLDDDISDQDLRNAIEVLLRLQKPMGGFHSMELMKIPNSRTLSAAVNIEQPGFAKSISLRQVDTNTWIVVSVGDAFR